ncbi:MAG: hypothetical protein A2599_03585 [Candidatus Staskawiczbacteria bacterium RIFOXYD1_FULL_39_28]|uniref:DUF4352 domain-containing protein n=1 Tax=Candidatus Staskawiczbacteria bacterium RIFOXYC1_FULL_38_18 TaxID=1802229 RepID=A0A1G2JEK2_9BACT|nr:MAG: hypothetical protein A2401_01470 [Candidatus Staskawiczbacteria bacterium RIFOXYC1_FULL_38_18]OGZ91521.1 MAG: hypothetical protein A2599_03585 [Candidatus Staskawiczbacteria bacterium RIFOXYD1_FULL_39_28]
MEFNSNGQVARLLLVLAIIVFVAIIITFLVVKMAERPPKPPVSTGPEIPLPVYEQKLGNIRFVFQSATDLGSTLRASEATNSSYTVQKDLTTREKFIEVIIGAQNMGTVNTEQGAWDIGNIVDSDGRNFIPVENYSVNAWLPAQTGCGALLKPAFNPTLCVKIYEVAKESTGLKIEVQTGAGNNSANDFSAGRRQKYLLDLIIK